VKLDSSYKIFKSLFSLLLILKNKNKGGVNFMKYCNNCKQMVEPKKDLNAALLIILLICGVIPGLIYYLVKKKSCPMCNSTNWGVPPRT
jgi:hypothetical protein